MRDEDLLAHRFEENRPRLLAVAHRMLGSEAEAEDAVQEAWLRLSRSQSDGIEGLTAWLTTVVGRICLDMLRTRRSRREDSLEVASPPADNADPADQSLLADAVGLALLVVLDALTPAERLAFVLHDMFAVPFTEIAPIVGRSLAATRQLASRGRRRVQAQPGVPQGDVVRQCALVEAFLAAARNGQFAALVTMLDPDVVMRADAAAVAMGGVGEMRGAEAVAAFYSGRAQHARTAFIDSAPGAVVGVHDALRIAISFTIVDDRIVAIDVVADPEQLGELDVQLTEGNEPG